MDEKQILKFMPSVMIQYSFKSKEAKTIKIDCRTNYSRILSPLRISPFLNYSTHTHTHVE